jgi:hypothetical protein
MSWLRGCSPHGLRAVRRHVRGAGASTHITMNIANITTVSDNLLYLSVDISIR